MQQRSPYSTCTYASHNAPPLCQCYSPPSGSLRFCSLTSTSNKRAKSWAGLVANSTRRLHRPQPRGSDHFPGAWCHGLYHETREPSPCSSLTEDERPAVNFEARAVELEECSGWISFLSSWVEQSVDPTYRRLCILHRIHALSYALPLYVRVIPVCCQHLFRW